MSYFNKSIFRQFESFLWKRYGYDFDLHHAERNLVQKISENSEAKEPLVRMQLDKIILPAVCIYEELRLASLPEKETLKLMKQYVFCYYKKTAKFLALAGKLPVFPSLFRFFFPMAMKMYPQGYWDIHWEKKTKHEVAFTMTDCLYYRTFSKYHCAKLTRIFCALDEFNFTNMSSKVKFLRTKTLGRNGDCCDFGFLIK